MTPAACPATPLSDLPCVSGLRVALVSPGFPPDVGGVETHVSRLADELSALGCHVEVHTQVRHRGGTRAGREDTGDVVVHRFADVTRSHRFQLAPSLWRHLRYSGGPYDVVHADGFHASPALMAAAATDGPFVFTPHFHGVGHTALARVMHMVYDPLSTHVFRRASAVLCVSASEARMIRTRFPQCSERIHVVPNGTDDAALRAAEPYGVDHPVVLAVGRLERYKRIDLLMHAAALLDREVELVVIGDGPERTSLARQARKSPMRVRLLGSVDEHTLHRWQKTASVCVNLSLHEAFGIAALDALASGARLLASDIPAHREVLEGRREVELISSNAGFADIACALNRALRLGRIETPDSIGRPWSAMARDVALQYVAAVEGARP